MYFVIHDFSFFNQIINLYILKKIYFSLTKCLLYLL